MWLTFWILFNCAILDTVVPYICAIPESVSPGRTTWYVALAAVLTVGVGAALFVAVVRAALAVGVALCVAVALVTDAAPSRIIKR